MGFSIFGPSIMSYRTHLAWSYCLGEVFGVATHPKGCFFVWSSAWDKILTCDNLMQRGYNMTSWCCMCGCSGETVDYLLLHCSMARALWSFVEFCVSFLWS